MSKFSNDIQAKLYAAKTTVIADYLFTTPAVILQPLTGYWLISQSGIEWDVPWLQMTYLLYAVAGLCWVPVVFIQIKLKAVLQQCADNNSELPTAYHQYFKI